MENKKGINAFKKIACVLVVLIIAAGLAYGGLMFLVKYKGPRLVTASTEKINSSVCLYESERGKAYIDSEIARLLRYRDEGIENYFPDLTPDEVAEYVENNLHTLIAALEDKGYSHDALRKAQAIYIYYDLGMIGWDYTGVFKRDVDTVMKTVDADGNFLFDPDYWRDVCYKSGV